MEPMRQPTVAERPLSRLPQRGGTTPVRVMVVDDNAGFRESLLALLDTEELLVVGEADSGERALDIIEVSRPDVVLMDVRLPTMDGIEATRRLKQRHPEIGVVALTGNEDREIVRDMLVAGATGYVLKDSDGEHILTAIRQAAGGRALLSPGVTPTVIEELTEALQRERRRARELEAAHAALLERSERRHELVARLGHELRTPVTVILGMAQILAAGSVPDGQRSEILERLVTRAGGLARLIERLEVALDTGLVEHVDVEQVARMIASGHSRIRVVTQPGLPPADLNVAVAKKILEELVDNALDFTLDGGPIEIRIARGAVCLEIRVVDGGPGIREEDADRIFEPLEQGEALNVRVHQGPGLGLSIARTAARAMGGDVVLESTGPEGSTFLWTAPFSGA